jgi:hypothetical protein
MILAVVTFVVTGIVAALLLGIGLGFDPTAYLILGLIALTGLGAVLIARRFKAGLAGPAQCKECGGYISPNAPFCKHCNAIT